MSRLSIVLPCFNPPDNWVELIITTYSILGSHLGFDPELIVVDDGSYMDIGNGFSCIAAVIPKSKLIQYKTNRGKGFALRKGVAAATSPCIIYTDIDFPYTIDSFLKVYHSLLQHTDVAIAVKDDNYYQQTPPARRFISKSLRKMIRLFFRMKITDTQCGLKGFNEKGKSIFLQTTIDRYLFNLEFVYRSFRSKQNLKIEAIKVQLREGIVFRKMNMKQLSKETSDFLKLVFARI